MSSAASTSGILNRVRSTVLATAAGFPRESEIHSLRGRLTPALERGYFTPSEDEQIRELYARYLHARTALYLSLEELRKQLPRWHRAKNPEAVQAFLLGWTSGCILMRAARYLVTEFYPSPALRKLLNEAEPRYGIPEGSLDQIYRTATHPLVLLRFLHAARFAERHADQIEALRDCAEYTGILELLDQEQAFIERQTRKHARALLENRWSRLRAKPGLTYQRIMWEIFETSGRAIAEMRNPFHRKRVTRKIRRQVSEVLQPGDILITRHDDALSNLFLPGFWPHSALIIGHTGQREALGIQVDSRRRLAARPPLCVLEAKKDGVRFRSLRETLRVDAFVLLRPRTLSESDLKSVIERAFSHEGKLYDFSFDFTRADRLVCTEVIYRSFEGFGDIAFTLRRRAGRFTLSAEDLLRQSLQTNLFDVVLLYGIPGNHIFSGERARQILLRSLSMIQ
ncbi:MAG: hypothetical protein JJU05_03490 [Verrucomicrobia bacterium]|nr:hypothetical protein [Verrucomicrobiota bacterium]MCH8526530.1 hypothetical protein [Kiritimatiellia bacterium]